MKKTFLLFIALWAISNILMAQTKTWVGGTVGNLTSWEEPNNWSPVGVPTATDAVLLNANTANDPSITGVAVAKSIEVSNGGCILTVQIGGNLTVSNVGNAINFTAGYMYNYGTITASNTRATQPGNEGALRMTNGNFYQYGTLNLIGGNTYGISATGASTSQITLYSGSVTNVSGEDGIRFSTSTAFIDMRSGSEMTVTGNTRSIFLSPGKIEVSGKLTAIGNVEHTGLDGSFITKSCGSINITGNLATNSQSSVTNAGSFVVSGNLNTGNGFTNNGVLKYGTTSGNPITNRRTIVFDTGSPTGVFTIVTTAGSTSNIGIFSDPIATISAGTYTSGTNTFSILPTYGEGQHLFYAKMTQSICDHIVPFTYSRPSTRWYVMPTSAGTADGRSWANASGDLQGTINTAIGGDSIFVGAGIYKPSKDASGNASPADVRKKLFFARSGISIFGGFLGTETSVSQRNLSNNKTILSGDIDNNDTDTNGNSIADSPSDIVGNNAYQVFVLNNCSKYTIIDGLIFTGSKNPNTTGLINQSVNGSSVYAYTGAVPIQSSSPIINNCVFSGNSGFYGTINVANTNSTDTIFFNNNYLINNFATYGGSAFFSKGNSVVKNSIFANNNADYGGAFMVGQNLESDRTIDFKNVNFVNNYSTYSKSMSLDNGIINLTNCIIHNTTPYSGGNLTKSGPAVLNSKNSILQSSGAGTAWLNNYGNDLGGNYDLNPQFIDIADLDGPDNKFFNTDDGLTVSSCSPAINTGMNFNFTTDLIANPRIFGAVSDIGAYEFQASSTRPADATSVSASSYAITCGQSVTLSASCSTGTITWYTTPNGGSNVGTGNNLVVNPLNNPTKYYASCETSATCVSLTRTAVNEIAVTLPTAPIGVSSNLNNVCPSTTITLSASCSGGTSPEWYNASSAVIGSGNSIQVAPNATTTYSVKCKINSCLSTAESITINVMETPVITVQSEEYICSGQPITYTATCLVGTVQWYDASSGGNLVGTGNTLNYTPTITTSGYKSYYPQCSNGSCVSSRSLQGNSSYFFAKPRNISVSNTSLCTTGSISLSALCSASAGGTTAKWYDAPTGGNLIGSGSPVNHSPTTTTTYYVECLSNSYGCSTERIATDQVSVGTPTTPTGVSTDKVLTCPNTNIVLSATCSVGTPFWYDVSSGGVAIGSGTSFTYQVAATKTYYAQCQNGACTPSNRVATFEVVVGAIGSNISVTGSVSGTNTYLSSNTISSTGILATGSNIKMQANNSISLNPLNGSGFKVENGAVFEAKIVPITGCN
jgi:Ig-like domain CHU_C associated